ncbi:hypothetical protein BDF22DRAFT_696871 [Syncephalis plumigaleata]|nr:hypothetical protein BDF22DRAFT_696871 [Syncephalis plumigaleata]
MDQDERYANPKLDYSSQHNAYGGPANYQHQHLHQQYQHDNYEMHSVPHNNHNNNNYYNGSSNAPYANNPSEPTDKPAADVWDFPDGSRPSRTNAHGNQPIATGHGYSASGSTSRPPVVAPAPVGPILDPTGPAYGKFKLERRCCGCRQRYCIIVTFFVLIAIALILFFAWPRIPTASVSSVNTTKGMVINMPGKTPIDKTTGMEGSWSVVLSVENPNFIPWPFKTVTVDVTDPHLISNGKIGTGSLNNLRLSRGFTGIKVPVEIKYNASNATDPALVGMSNACDNGQLLSLNFNIFFQIAGLTFFKGTSTAAANYNCQTP